MSIFLLSALVCLPKVSCSSNNPAFSNSLGTRTGKMCKIYTFISSLIIRETAHLKAYVLKSSLFMKDSILVLSRGTNDTVTVVHAELLKAQDHGNYSPTIC